MTQVDVAKKCGIHTVALNEIIKNKRSINVRYAKAFEDLFGVPVMIWLIWDNLDAINKEEKK